MKKSQKSFRDFLPGTITRDVEGCQPQERREMKEKKVVNSRAASRARGLDVDGINTCKSAALRPRVRGRESEKLLCTWREACKAADYVLEHFGDKSRDRGIWIWYCRRIGLDVFLDIADEVISSARQGELRWPTRALQRHLQEALPKGSPSEARSAKGGVA